ncbi:MAG: hypothetical protein A3G34_13150 [Candidatus Lindowbacteria bacterium RIFCSPLOWO2_12_FULL_62_27]|nr:MAG: hypothetical protein A3I06_14900 [Candidatus Lindowbacteria bacterium RIFCSPLOWO2_02_FULL_62_12]OGH62531.1 MAG: hypothetical protein A3G34_13150 [Candidatus Lindowbacteria bacterium RIFCSPLOWO2_12_FULL_62_27]
MQIDFLFYARLSENMVAPLCSFIKAKSLQKMAQGRETDICIRRSTQYPQQKFLIFAHVVILEKHVLLTPSV